MNAKKAVIKNEIERMQQNLEEDSRHKLLENLQMIDRLSRASILFEHNMVTPAGQRFLRQICGDILDAIDHLEGNRCRLEMIQNELLENEGNKS